MIYDINGNILCDDKLIGNFTAEQCTSAFLDYMAQKCVLYGMTGTRYDNPSGLIYTSYSTPQDEMKLGIAILANREASSIWATPDRSFNIGGENARTISVVNNVLNGTGETLNAAGYKFLGGKGGSLASSTNGYHRASLDVVDINGVAVVIALMALGQTAYSNIQLSAKELCDMVKASLDGNTPTPGTNLQYLVANGGGYCACIVPTAKESYVNLMTPAELLLRDHSIYNSQTVSRVPASTTKAMTMMCALDYITNPYDIVTVKTPDIVGGSGSTFYDGDVLTMHDALRIMMMESSNTLANTIGRETGRKILSYSISSS